MPGPQGANGMGQIQPQWLTEVAPHYYKQKDIEEAIQKKMPKGRGRGAATG